MESLIFAQKINVNRSAIERAIHLSIISGGSVTNYAERVDIFAHIAASEVLCEVLCKEFEPPVLCGVIELLASGDLLFAIANPPPPLSNLLSRTPTLNRSSNVE